MQDMSPNNDLNYPASFTGSVFRVTQLHYVLFSVTGLSAGQITFQYRPMGRSDWYTIDAELVLTANGLKYAIMGGVDVRAIGDGSVAGTDLFVGVEGRYVFRQP